MKVIILILASKDSEHEIDLSSQQKTWVNSCNKDVTVIFLRGWDQDYYFENKNSAFSKHD